MLHEEGLVGALGLVIPLPLLEVLVPAFLNERISERSIKMAILDRVSIIDRELMKVS